MGFEKEIVPEAPLFAVRSEVIVNAPPEKVWTKVVTFSELPPAKDWIFRLGIACPTCATYSRAYLHHLIKSGEMLGAILMTEHNIGFYQQLMASMREAIRDDRFAAFARTFRDAYLGAR